MADGDTTTPDATTLDPALINRLLQQTLNPQAMPSPTAPSASSHEGRGLLSLFGEALGGGEQYGTTAEREQGGLRALQSAGLNMLLNSDYSVMPHSLGSIVASGLGGAQRSLGETQAVSAAQQSAALDYQQKQQEMQLARIKEALPLLTLQQQMQQAQTARQLAGGGGGNIATGGSIAAPTTFEGAIAGHEGTGKNPNSSATGVGQFLDSTWQGFTAANPDLFKGMTPAQVQAARNDPAIGAKAINWLAQQNASVLQASGVTPSGTSLGIAHYVGAKPAAAVMQAPDSALVKNFVSEAAVKANPELATMTAGQLRARYANTPNPGFLGTATAATPPAAPTAQTPPAPAPRAPVGTPADALPTGGATVAGPAGAATVGAPRPAGPAVPGDVNAIIAGMTGAGANASTLAAGGAQSALQPPAQVATTAPVVPPATTSPTPPPSPYPDIKAGEGLIRHPGTFAEYLAREHVPPPASEDFNPNLSPAQQAAYDLQRRQIATLPFAEQPKAYAELTATIRDATQAKAEAAAKAQTTYNVGERDKIQARYDAALAAYNDAAKTAQTASETRLTNKDQAVNAANQNGLIAAQKEQAESRDKVAALDGFRAISDGVGQPGWLQTTKFPGSEKSIAEQLGQLGMPLSDTAGVQLLHGAMTNLTRELRSGLAMGTLSDRDLDFVARLGPTDWMDPDTRSAAVGYLQQAYRAKMRFTSDLQKEMSRGKNYGDAFDAADAKQKPFVPSAPADITAHWTDNSPEWAQKRLQWAQQNDVRPGTLFHLSDGSIHIAKTPKPPRQP